MFLDFLLLLLGMALLLGGGEALVRGASALARALGVSPLMVGLTVVSFATSAPELAVNVTAAWRGSGAISFGNIVGSNMANIGLIVAGAALLRPLAIQNSVLLREIPMMLLATALACVLGLDDRLTGRPGSYDLGDGLTLLLVFGVFVYYTLHEVLVQMDHTPDRPAATSPDGPSVRASLALSFAGLVGLVVGAQLTVEGGMGLARSFGVPEVLIGLTVIAVGTSLPELAATTVAAMRGHSDIAVGNVVGSNIFNLLFVMGCSATVGSIRVPQGGSSDLAFMMFISILLWLVAATRGRQIIRAEGGLLLLVYLAYLIQRSLLSGAAASG